MLVLAYSINGELVDFAMPIYGSAMTQAVTDVISNFYTDKSTTVNFFYALEPETDKHEVENVINEILYLLHNTIVVQIEEYSHIKQSNDKKWHNIIFCDTYESFSKVFTKMDPESFEYQGYYLIAISRYNDGIYEMMKKIFADLWIQHITNVNILWMLPENYDEVLMWTYWPYSSSYCGEAIPLQLNHYRHGKWLRPVDYFPNKMTNLHGNFSLKIHVRFSIKL